MTSSLSRFNRAFDTLKKAISKTPEEINRQKLKYTSCATITDLVCKSNDKSSLLTIAVTSLIQLLENSDSNNRLIVDESLNKIIRSSIDNSNDIAKVLIALLKILSKSTHERSLKAALWRFAELAHFVRPHKGKIYVQTLIPVFVKLAGRREDGIHEVSASSFPRIFRYIGLFTTDSDIKVLLNAFLKNLSSPSVEIRRAAAFNITVICQYSHLLADAQSIDRKNVLLIQGCLSCVRQIVSCNAKPRLELEDELADKNLQLSLQIYELCFTFASSLDHNIVTAALETLQQLLLSASPSFVEKLTTLGTFTQSSVLKREFHGSALLSTAQSEIFSIGSTIAQTDDDIFSGELSKKLNSLRRGSGNFPDVSEEQKQKMTENWVQEQSENDEDDVSSSSLLNMDTSHFANSDDEDNQCEVDSTLSFRTLSVDNIQVAKETDEKNFLNRSAFQSMKSVSVMSSASLGASLINLSTDIDIGSIFDEDEIPLHYSARFLVTRFLLSDKSDAVRPTRVSVMSLALNCLAQIMKIHPATGFISIVADKEIYEDFANLLEVVLFHASHNDQQIRGCVRLVIGNVIYASLVQDSYLLIENDRHLLNKTFLTELVGFLLQGLEDESSMCIRNCLQGVTVCLEPLLLTPEYRLAVPLLDSMFTLMDNPYWLIKTKILEILENISYDLLYFVADNCSYYQEKIFHKIILSCLEDADGRIRRAAAQCLSKFVLHAYYPMDHNYELVAATFAKRYKSGIEISYISKKEDSSSSRSDITTSTAFKRTLARVVHKLSQNFASKSSSKNVIVGYCEALSFLANEYPPIQYAESWKCCYFAQLTNASILHYSPCDLFDAALLLMTNSALILNFDVHIHLLKLSSQLFIALCNSNFKVTENSSTSFDKLWSYLNDEKLKDLAEFFLRHLMRLSTIFNDVVTDVTVKSSITLNSSQPLLRPIPTDQPLLMLYQSPLIDMSNTKQSEHSSKSKINNKSVPFGQYNREPRYLKLKVSLKSAYNNYQVTLKPESSEKFISFLETFLNSFATVLDFITTGEVDRICKELLRHLRNFMIFLPVSSVHCVVQLFKCVFGNNRISDQFSDDDMESIQNGSTDFAGCGFHAFCFQRPYNNLTKFLETKQHQKTETQKESWELPPSPSRSVVAKQRRNLNMNTFPMYIKLFEPNVIQSLKQYTVASDTALQAEVLNLLSQLIQLKVNYCLLDSEQVFIKFLLSQFQLIEDEQLQSVDKLLPAMFDFLIQLANEKHSKPIMCVPKVIQLCDSLTASIQSVCHCILAIEPVVKHVFTKFTAIANSEEIKELETQQDVLFSILLRLIHNPKSLPLLTIILNNSVDDKKLQRSIQITQILFMTLVECHMPVDEESRSYLVELLFTLHPASFDDQILLCSMFDLYCSNKTKDLNTWFPFISLLLLALFSKCDENTIIGGLEKLREHPIFTDENAKDARLEDPLCVNVAKSVNMCPETTFVQFLYRLLTMAFQHLERTKLLHDSNEKIVLLRELLLILGYIVKSGKFELIRRKLIENYAYDEENDWIFEITRSSYILSTVHPVIALQWYELLLYFRDKSGELRWYFGPSSIRFSCGRPPSSVCNVERQCIGNDAIKIGVFLLACECRDEFIHDEVVFRAFLENYFSILINCLSDEPVQNLMAEIRNSETASRILIDTIRKMLDDSAIEDNKLKDVLYLLDFVNEEICADVLLLCSRSEFLNSSSFPVREQAITLLTKIISSLANSKEKMNLKKRLSKDQLQSVIDDLSLLKSWRSRTLLNSTRNVALEQFGIQVAETDSNLVEELESLRLTSINKEWFFKEVKKKCCDGIERDYRKLAVLLGELSLQDLLSVMEEKSFQCQILAYAFDVGLSQSLEECKAVNDDSLPKLSPLFIASRSTLYRFVEHVKLSLPQVHEVYWPVKRVQQKREILYSQRIDSLFSNKPFLENVHDIIPAVEEFVVSVQKLKLIILPESFQQIVDFAVLCSQIAHWQTKYCRKWSKIRVIHSIRCCSSVLKIKSALDLVSPAQIGSIISAAFFVAETHFKDVIKLPTNPIMENATNADSYRIHHSSHEISTLIDYFIAKVPAESSSKSTSLEFSLRELLLVLSRSDLIYNYVRIPLDIWKHVPQSHVIMGNCLTLNTIPEHFLLDSDILRNFVSRLMFIGWNSRLQFEECWMLLLIAFNSIPEEESSEEEVEVLSQVNVVAVSAVTSILVQTMYHPQPGSKVSPNILHVSRYNNFHLNQCRKKRRLATVNHLLCSELKKNNDDYSLLFDNVNVNLEKLNYKNVYSFNQISIEYLSLCCQKNLNETPDIKEERINELYQERIQIFQKMGIDVNSCVYFLMDFYSRWLLKPHTHSVHVLLEVVNSMFIISDLFTEVSQFTWLLESCIIMWQRYQKDNDTVCSYLIVMMCKAAAVFVPVDSETKKLVIKALRTGLSSKFGSVQSAALHGLLYLLEKIFKKNTLNDWENLSCEFESEILSTSITFVLQNVNVDLLEIFEKETAECLISISFYLIENNAGGDNADLLIDRVLKLSVRVCKLKLWDVNSTIMQGFYNLLLFDNKRVSDYNNELGQLVKEILSTVSCPPFVCIQCLQMLATCMYLSDEFEDRTNEEANESFDTEKLVARMEKISFFFKRIQIGTKSEARFICTLLPQILIDLFPSSEILNKVILEFLSPSQRYPELMAQIVFKVFQHMIQQSELPLIQDWVLSLLNNSRNYPTEKAVFYLTCLFISACSNPWLLAFFPLISLRHKEVQYDDRQLLYLSAVQFYSQLTSESQRKAFVTTFRAAEENNPRSPLSDILKIIL